MESVLGGRAGTQRQLKSLLEHSTGVGTLTISHYKSETKLETLEYVSAPEMSYLFLFIPINIGHHERSLERVERNIEVTTR